MLKIIALIVAAVIPIGFTSAFAQTQERGLPEQSLPNDSDNNNSYHEDIDPDTSPEPLYTPPPTSSEPPLTDEQGQTIHRDQGGTGGSGPLSPDKGGTSYTAP